MVLRLTAGPPPTPRCGGRTRPPHRIHSQVVLAQLPVQKGFVEVAEALVEGWIRDQESARPGGW